MRKTQLLRRIFLFLLAISVIYFLIFISVNFIFQDEIKGILEERLSKLINAQVSIKGFKTDLLTAINFKDIHIRKEDNLFYLYIPQINFKYQPLSLFKIRFKGKIESQDLLVSYKALKIKENLLINFSIRALIFDKVLEIEEFFLYAQDVLSLKAKGRLKPLFKPREASFQIQIPFFSYPNFNLKDLIFNFNFLEGNLSGKYFIGVLNYNKFSLNNISSKITLKDKKINLKDLEGCIFDGKIKADAVISTMPFMDYEFNLKVSGLVLEDILTAFASDFRATGIIEGDLSASIEERDLRNLKGRFYSKEKGSLDMKIIKRFLSGAKILMDKKIFDKEIFYFDSLKGDLSLLNNDIIVKLVLVGKEVEFKFDIKIEPEVLVDLLKRRQ